MSMRKFPAQALGTSESSPQERERTAGTSNRIFTKGLNGKLTLPTLGQRGNTQGYVSKVRFTPDAAGVFQPVFATHAIGWAVKLCETITQDGPGTIFVSKRLRPERTGTWLEIGGTVGTDPVNAEVRLYGPRGQTP